MNKQKYLAELGGLLSFLTEEDRAVVMSHYTRKFDEAGEAGEAALIQELGTPMRLAINLNRMGIEAIAEAEAAAEKTPETPPAEPVQAAELIQAVLNDPDEENTENTAPAPDAEAAEESSAGEDMEAAGKPEPSEEAEAVEETGSAEGSPQEATALTEEPAEEEQPEAEMPEVPEEVDAKEVNEVPETDENAAEAEPAEEEEIIQETEIAEDPDEEAEPEPEDALHTEAFPELTVARGGKLPDAGQTPAKISVGGAILFWILMIVPGVPLLVISAALIPVLLAPGLALAWASSVGLRAGIACMSYIPDAMFVLGGGLLLLGGAILLLLLAAWLIRCILHGWNSCVPALWNRLARKEKRV